jgi:MFS family permease
MSVQAPSTVPTPPTSGDSPGFNEQILFWASFLTLIAAGIGFSVRGAILGDWSKQFGFTQGELGSITGGGLVGFGLTIIVFSFLADTVGYGWLMVFAFLFHTSSAVVTLMATYYTADKQTAYWFLYTGAFLFSLGNGTCEAVINPLTATLYPKNKTHWLNILHAGWPGGLVLGALLGLLFEAMHTPWEIQIASFLVPTALYGLLMFRRKFPTSEAKDAGVTVPQMLKEVGLLGGAVLALLCGLWFSDIMTGFGVTGYSGWILAAIIFFGFGSASQFRLGHWMLAFLFLLHAMVGYVELGTDSWITNITGRILDNKSYGLWLFVWTSGLMFALRFFAGPIVHKISPLGLLFISAILGSLGLVMLGNATGVYAAIICIVAATIYGLGKTFFWPTMLGVVSERFPQGGAVTLGMIGGIGMLSAGLLGGPGIGYNQDVFASSNLREKNEQTFERYAARNDKGKIKEEPFLFLPATAALDGTKVADLLGKPGQNNGDGALLVADLKAWEVTRPGKTPADLVAAGGADQVTKALYARLQWWDEAKKHAPEDAPLVEGATRFGGQMALICTAAVPAAMAIGYLLLILYFRAVGGYKAEQLVGHGAEDERYTGGTTGPGEG